MSELRKAAQQALDHLLSFRPMAWSPETAEKLYAAITALRAALAQPEPEPVVWMQTENFIDADGLWDKRKTFNFDGIGIPLKP